MIRIRVIGIGSPSGDDRAGWDAIAAVQASRLLRRFPADTVDACCCPHPGALLGLFSGVEAAIVIDAMQSGAPAGTVRKLVTDELVSGQGGVSVHGIGVADSLALGRTLGLLPPVLLLYGIEVRNVATGAEPAQAVGAAIPGLLHTLFADVENLVISSL